MEPALKQRLIGAMVLVALAVIFLPMLIKGPAPESGVSDVSLSLPDAPQGGFETRELPLVMPGNAPTGGAVGMDQQHAGHDGVLPTVSTTTADTNSGAGSGGMMPAATAGGDYAVSFGSYASTADAARVVAALTASQLPGYQELASTSGGRTLHRVRIGPYATQAEAEAARLRAAHVRDDVGAKVVVLDANAATSPSTPRTASVSQPAAAATTSVSAPVALPETKATAKPALIPDKSAEVKPAASVRPPAATPSKPVASAKPAAAGVGFAVQLGAFGSTDDANKLRDRARAAGFSAFVQEVRTDKGVLSRVRVGPVADRAAAEQLVSQVSTKLGISGIVQSHP